MNISTAIRSALKITGLMLCLALPFSAIAKDSFYVITNANNSVLSLSKSDIKNIFLGKIRSFPNGSQATPLNLRKDSSSRKFFMDEIIQTSETKWRSHWARLIFTGKGRPPKEYPSPKEIIALVSQRETALGYFFGELEKIEGITVLLEIPAH
ncbi:hypothetical protein A9Q99_12775 [Gammaproteobacteria bacterium 45_16_T64]|nr:hypothetical protein A9Q99_12775 [Gammaproteobacteria bacterium 45_16_T64]